MLQDNDLIFFESDADATGAIKEIDGSSLSRDFIFCTIPAGVTALALTVKTGNAKTSAGITSAISAVHNATAVDIARGAMYVPTPTNDYKYIQVDGDLTGSASKALVCGITDAPNNIEVHVDSGYTAD